MLESVQRGVTGAFYDDATTRTRWPRPCSPSTRARSTRPVCVAAAERFGVARFQDRLRAIVAEATSAERPPRPGERSRLQAGLLHGARRARRALRRTAGKARVTHGAHSAIPVDTRA